MCAASASYCALLNAPRPPRPSPCAAARVSSEPRSCGESNAAARSAGCAAPRASASCEAAQGSAHLELCKYYLRRRKREQLRHCLRALRLGRCPAEAVGRHVHSHRPWPRAPRPCARARRRPPAAAALRARRHARGWPCEGGYHRHAPLLGGKECWADEARAPPAVPPPWQRPGRQSPSLRQTRLPKPSQYNLKDGFLLIAFKMMTIFVRAKDELILISEPKPRCRAALPAFGGRRSRRRRLPRAAGGARRGWRATPRCWRLSTTRPARRARPMVWFQCETCGDTLKKVRVGYACAIADR